jgi:hypothetical protein
MLLDGEVMRQRELGQQKQWLHGVGIFGLERLRVLFDRLVGHTGNELGH